MRFVLAPMTCCEFTVSSRPREAHILCNRRWSILLKVVSLSQQGQRKRLKGLRAPSKEEAVKEATMCPQLRGRRVHFDPVERRIFGGDPPEESRRPRWKQPLEARRLSGTAASVSTR
eukprot:77995-Hanusia_phi.AAC.1